MSATVPRTTRGRAAGVAGLLVPLAGLGVAVAPPASAHDELVSSSPDDGAQVTAPKALTLAYSESLVGTGYRVVVRGPDGPVDGDVRLAGARLVDRFSAPLPPGPYDVVWRVVSADGHPISGRLSFTVRAVATSSTTTTASPSPTSTSSSSEPTSSAPSPTAASSTPTPDSGDAGSNRGSLALGVALAAAVGAAVAAAVTRRARGPRA